MAKSDFNIEEENYDLDNIQNLSSNTDNLNDSNKKDSLYNYDYGENSDFSNIGITNQNDFIDNSSVVFEENKNESNEDRLKYFLSTVNKNLFIIGGGILFVIIIIIILISISIAKTNATYKSTVAMPSIVYMNETSNISIISEGKKNADKTSNSFNASNNLVVDFVENKMVGKDVLNTIVPLQEGVTKVKINTTLGNGKNTTYEKKLTVCPAFTPELLVNKSVSVVKGSKFDLKIGFGKGECSKNIEYESNNGAIMTVDANGQVKGLRVGHAILTIKKGSRSFSVPVYVTRNFVSLESLSVVPERVQLVPGQNFRVKASFAPYNFTTRDISYYVDNEYVLNVDKQGLVTALKEGNSKVRVSDPDSGRSKEIIVVVKKAIVNQGEAATDLELDVSSLNLVQGDSKRIIATVSPDDAKDKTVTFSSNNKAIAIVTKNGTVYAKGSGSTVITAKTSNNIVKNVSVTVTNVKTPYITTSDGIGTEIWHNKSFNLIFSGSESGSDYYYGITQDKMNMKGTSVNINTDQKATYYVKGCKEKACSEIVSYVVKLDSTKPKILSVAGIESYSASEDSIYIAMKDATSLIKKWCVSTFNNSSKCKWKTIKSTANPVVTFVAKNNGTYYVFAQDGAGNISDSYTFEITNIE